MIQISTISRENLAQRLRDQTIAATIVRLFQMYVDIFGPEVNLLDSVGKREGQEVELYFKAHDTKVTLNLSKSRLSPYMGGSDRASATLILKMKKEEVLPTIVDLMRTKSNFAGLIRVLLKYVLTGKIKIKGSLGAAIKVIKLLCLGSHPMWKKS